MTSAIPLPLLLETMNRVDQIRSEEAQGMPLARHDSSALIEALKHVYEHQGISISEKILAQAAEEVLIDPASISFDSSEAWKKLSPRMAASVLLEQHVWRRSEEDKEVEFIWIDRVLQLFSTRIHVLRNSRHQQALVTNQPLVLATWIPPLESESNNAASIFIEQKVGYANKYLAALVLWRLLRNGWDQPEFEIHAARFVNRNAHLKDQIDWEAEAFAMDLLLPERIMKQWRYKKRWFRNTLRSAERISYLTETLPEMVEFRFKQLGWSH